MKMLSRFWSGLETLPGPSGVLAEWERVWRKDMEVGRTFLRLTGQLATTYPCPSPGGDGCPRGVVRHGEQDIVAVCRSRPRQCDTLTLTKIDIAIYELDWKRLGAAISTALNLTSPERPTTTMPLTERIGWYGLGGGLRAAVYLTIHCDSGSFGANLSRLSAGAKPPFILAAPTADLCGSEGGELLRQTGVLLFPLNEGLSWDEAQGFVAIDRAKVLLADFAAVAAMYSARGSAAARRIPAGRIQVPDGIHWGELHVVVDDLALRYRVREKRGRIGFREALFEDGRRRKIPNDAWRLLQVFAKGRGRFSRPDAVPGERSAKHPVSALRKRLQHLFPIPGDPIKNLGQGRYVTGFEVMTEDGLVLPVPAEVGWSKLSITETPTGSIRFGYQIKKRFLAYGDGQATEFPMERVGAKDLADATKECDLWNLGLVDEEDLITESGQALLEVLRYGGRVRRGEYDKAMLDLGGRLSRATGIDGAPFDFRSGQWTANFEASSEHADQR